MCDNDKHDPILARSSSTSTHSAGGALGSEFRWKVPSVVSNGIDTPVQYDNLVIYLGCSDWRWALLRSHGTAQFHSFQIGLCRALLSATFHIDATTTSHDSWVMWNGHVNRLWLSFQFSSWDFRRGEHLEMRCHECEPYRCVWLLFGAGSVPSTFTHPTIHSCVLPPCRDSYGRVRWTINGIYFACVCVWESAPENTCTHNKTNQSHE